MQFGGKALLAALVAYIALMQAQGLPFRSPPMESAIAIIDGFEGPYGMTVFPDGDLYVADALQRQVIRIGADGARSTVVTFSESDAFPHAIARDAEGTLYVPDHRKGRISRIAKNGTLMNDFVPKEPLSGPVHVLADDRNRLWISDYKAHRILLLDTQGTLLRSMGSEATDTPGQFDQPHMVAIDEDGNIYVADVNNHRIQKFAPDGRFLGWIGAYADGSMTKGWMQDGRSAMNTKPGGFKRPTSVAVSGDLLIVADTENNRIVRYDAKTGAFRGWMGGKAGGGVTDGWAMDGEAALTDATGGFHNPFGAQMHDGKLYVADTGNKRIQIIPLVSP